MAPKAKVKPKVKAKAVSMKQVIKPMKVKAAGFAAVSAKVKAKLAKGKGKPGGKASSAASASGGLGKPAKLGISPVAAKRPAAVPAAVGVPEPALPRKAGKQPQGKGKSEPLDINELPGTWMAGGFDPETMFVELSTWYEGDLLHFVYGRHWRMETSVHGRALRTTMGEQ